MGPISFMARPDCLVIAMASGTHTADANTEKNRANQWWWVMLITTAIGGIVARHRKTTDRSYLGIVLPGGADASLAIRQTPPQQRLVFMESKIAAFLHRGGH